MKTTTKKSYNFTFSKKTFLKKTEVARKSSKFNKFTYINLPVKNSTTIDAKALKKVIF